MALPAGAATATITVGVSTDIAGEAGTITGLAVRPECRLVWAATGQPIEDWNVGAIDAATATLVVLADQDGVVTSGTVAGAPALVAIRSWPMQAVWWVKSADGQRRKIVRRFPAALLTAGGTLDLDLLPAHGVVPPAQITYAQWLDFSTDMVADLAVGTVATGAPGTPAVASLTPVGDDAYTLDLTIPQGADGDPAPLPAFTATATTGAPGTNAAASVSGAYPNLSLDLTIPEGEQGNPGPANSLAIGTVTTGAAGSSAAATITGDAPSQTLNLTIPQGATGAVSAWEYYAAGRPDIVGTLDAAALAWRNAAPSGATFYSTDGPQGAWVWRKRGASWVCVEGDTGFRNYGLALIQTTQPDMAISKIRRLGGTVEHHVYGVSTITSRVRLTEFFPAGFRTSAPLFTATTYGESGAPTTVMSCFTVGHLDITATARDYIGSMMVWTTSSDWPTTLPGTPA